LATLLKPMRARHHAKIKPLTRFSPPAVVALVGFDGVSPYRKDTGS